jgi:SNF2 family DNA or RNA helicase
MVDTSYIEFLEKKSQLGGMFGFKPLFMPDFLFDFQKHLVDWSLRKGKGALFADCGLGKSPMALVWAQNIVEKENGNVLIITPLAVAEQFIREGEKFGIEVTRSRDGKIKKGITVTNYERLHYFNPNDFEGVVCDESSAIKNFEGERQKKVTAFLLKTKYRLLCTATAAPNDYIELGTSAEALGELGRMDMLSQFFVNDENSNHPIWWGARWRFKKHGEKSFWRWICSWARAIKKPSDLGYSDEGFKLPELIVNETIIKSKSYNGLLFPVEAKTLNEQRKERRVTMQERCEIVAEKVSKHERSVMWCHLNDEADLLEKLIPNSRQVSGSQSDEQKEEIFNAFTKGQLPYLIIKPKIGCWGLNWQHCNHMTFFPSHSYEQYYQGVRRCWRFGQKQPVTVDVVTSDGERGVFKNLQRKSEAAEKMFDQLVEYMNNSLRIDNITYFNNETKLPAWL